MSIDPGSSPPSQAVVQITMGRIYDVVTETRQEVRDLTTSMKGVVEHVGDHETRIRAIERDGATTEDVDAVREAAEKAVKEAAEKAAKAVKDLRDEHSPRLAAVEKRMWIGVGIGLVAATGCSGLIAYVATMR